MFKVIVGCAENSLARPYLKKGEEEEGKRGRRRQLSG